MKKQIYIIPDGPYQVSGNVPLRAKRTTVDNEGASVEWEDAGEYLPHDQPYHLCRCGRSAKKPYCDGTHETINFDGRETAKHEYADGDCACYSGAELHLYDNEALCASAQFCDRGVNAWNAVEQSDIPSNRALAVEEVSKCPSGRLTLRDKEGSPIEPALEQEVSPMESTVHNCRGPLWVQGGIQVLGSDCQPYQVRNRLTLCRCGESKNKPFCDSSHVYCPHMKGFDE